MGLRMPRVVHFEISTERPERTIRFYEKVFGWKSLEWTDGSMKYWLINTGDDKEPGMNGGMAFKDPRMIPANSIGVSSVDEYVERIISNGGNILVPKNAINGVGWLALFGDADDNVFGMMQDDKNAM